MKQFLSCMAVLGFLVGSASAELDLEARRELQNIREGKNDGKAIKNLLVTESVSLPAGSLDNADISASAAIARSKLSLGGVAVTNVIVSGDAKTNTIIAIDGVITSWVITQ